MAFKDKLITTVKILLVAFLYVLPFAIGAYEFFSKKTYWMLGVAVFYVFAICMVVSIKESD